MFAEEFSISTTWFLKESRQTGLQAVGSWIFTWWGEILTSQRPHLPIPLQWELELQHTDVGGEAQTFSPWQMPACLTEAECLLNHITH